jgi:anti-sigma regulatory factor (Ser/Thr protein kinase)
VSLLETSLAGVPGSVTLARRFAEAALSEFGLEDLSWEVVLLVSELVSNSVLHARGDVTLRLETLGPGEVRLDVRDGSAKLPTKRTFSDQSTTGRGLRLLEEIADVWGVRTEEVGKTVWAVCRRQEPDGTLREDATAATAEDVEAILSAFAEPDDDVAGGATVRSAA